MQYKILYYNMQPALGITFRGIAPPPIIGKVSDSDFEMSRVVLREVWNNTPLFRNVKDLGKYACTPFRKKLNAGDILTRVNYSCGGNCQTPQSIAGIPSIKRSIGSIKSICDDTFNPPSSCNVKYVYDSSVYTTFLKNTAKNRNYNDLSYGGDQNNSAASVIKSMRRF
jgi:hypothetical protein